jgi:RNA polymerase sigma-70 factor (ECF subfamily)
MLVGSGLDAEDMTQEVMLKAIQRFDQFDGRSNVYTWLYAIARNTVFDAMRRLKVERKIFYQSEEDESMDRFGAEIQQVETNERLRLFRQALGQLPEDQQELIRMKDFELLRYDQMAEILGIAEGTVKSRLFKARLRLKEALIELGYTPE